VVSGRYLDRIWTVKFTGDIWTVKIWTVKTGLGLGLGLGLVITVQVLTVQMKTGNRTKTGNR